MDKFIEKIVSEEWGKWSSFIIFLIFSTLTAVSIISAICGVFSYTVTYKNISYSKLTNTGKNILAVVIILVIALNIWHFIYVYNKNHIRRAKKNQSGIMIYLDAPTKKVYEDTVRKFGIEFSNNVSLSINVNFRNFNNINSSTNLFKDLFF